MMSLVNLLHICERNNTTSPQSPEIDAEETLLNSFMKGKSQTNATHELRHEKPQ